MYFYKYDGLNRLIRENIVDGISRYLSTINNEATCNSKRYMKIFM